MTEQLPIEAAEAGAAGAPADVHLFQIVYSAETLAGLQPGFQPLDNLENPRPDWYEYWPIRRYLLTTPLDEAAFYGFFSPRFPEKLGLDHLGLRAFAAANGGDADVLIFSPQPDMGALFLNVFEQAETFDPGMIATFEAVLTRLGRPAALAGMVMDSRQVAFSNYILARPAFWRAWLALNEAIFALAENPADPVGALLREATLYPGAAERKVFLMERVASFLLAETPAWRSRRCTPFRFAWSATPLAARPLLSVLSDAAKLAYRELGDPDYLAAFAALREDFKAPGTADAAFAALRGLPTS